MLGCAQKGTWTSLNRPFSSASVMFLEPDNGTSGRILRSLRWVPLPRISVSMAARDLC